MPATSLIANLGGTTSGRCHAASAAGGRVVLKRFPDYRMDRAQLVGVVTHHKPLEWNPGPPLNVVLAPSF